MANPTTPFGLARLHRAILAAGVPIVSVNSAGQVAPATLQVAAQPTIDAFDPSAAADAADRNASARTDATTAMDTDVTAAWKAIRAAAAVLVDELNLLRQWEMSFKAEVALAISLADLKSRVATLPALPDRTLAQAKTAMQTKISAGAVD